MSRKDKRPQGLSKADRDLWDYVTRAVDRTTSNRFTGFEVVPAKAPKSAKNTTKSRSKTPAKTINAESLAAAMSGIKHQEQASKQQPKASSETARGNVAGLDRRSSERLRKGQMPIEGRIDLHGLTQAEAHGRLRTFLSAAQIQGRRCVLVITGKGSSAEKSDDAAFMTRDRRGILREAVPKWLGQADLKRIVIDFRPAQPKHGGSGALYVLLRRTRS
ncbi:MAG: Smr/MutS family protein [Proteobacteria bacterium]|nr:Smr/MutS family protein [Pseudomonadota bacterium]